MSERTKEKLKEILSDLLEIRKVANGLYKKSGIRIFPWEDDISERRNEFYQEFADKWQELLVNEKITSCECRIEVKSIANRWQEYSDKKYNFLKRSLRQNNSQEMETSNGLSLDELISLTRAAIKGTATLDKVKKVNEALSAFGDCDVVFYEKDILEEAQSFAFNPDEIEISGNFSPSSTSIPTREI